MFSRCREWQCHPSRLSPTAVYPASRANQQAIADSRTILSFQQPTRRLAFTSMKRIADGINYAKLPEDPGERHEQLLECFGQDLVGLRNDAIKGVYGQLDRTSWESLLPY